jgi:hypothetical protein
MQKSQISNEVSNYKWEITVSGDKFELSEKGYQELMKKEAEGVRLVKIGDRTINPAFISSAKKIYKEQIKPASEFLDWSTIQPPKNSERYQQIAGDIKQMLKKKNMENPDYKLQVYKDEKHFEAVADVWEHLKSVLTTLEFPIIDSSWKDDSSIIRHTEGRESHSVQYKTKIINLGDKYDNNFWAEANFIFCETCRKHIRKQIVIFNDYESECILREC